MDMSVFQKRRWLIEFGLVCLVPIVLIGVFLLQTLSANVESRAIANAREQARLVAAVGFQTQLAGVDDLSRGLSGAQQAALDDQLDTLRAGSGLARVIIRNRSGRVVYADDHSLIGKGGAPSGSQTAIDGAIASDVTSEPGAGKVLSVFAPLRIGNAEPVGSV